MKAELLAKLLPSSCDMSSTRSKSNDSITSEDVLIKISYARLNNNELYYVLSKFLESNTGPRIIN